MIASLDMDICGGPVGYRLGPSMAGFIYFLPGILIYIASVSDIYWISCRNGQVHQNAIAGGKNKNNVTMFVGRAMHEQDLLPAKIVPSCNCAYVAYGGSEHAKTEYEVACLRSGNVGWQPCKNGQVPSKAVKIGEARNGEALYCGRVFHDGTMTPGKVHPSHQVCYIPYFGREYSYSEYEVLVAL